MKYIYVVLGFLCAMLGFATTDHIDKLTFLVIAFLFFILFDLDVIKSRLPMKFDIKVSCKDAKRSKR